MPESATYFYIACAAQLGLTMFGRLSVCRDVWEHLSRLQVVDALIIKTWPCLQSSPCSLQTLP